MQPQRPGKRRLNKQERLAEKAAAEAASRSWVARGRRHGFATFYPLVFRLERPPECLVQARDLHVHANSCRLT